MTQQELAGATGFTQSTISLWMNDGRRQPDDWSKRQGGRPSKKHAGILAAATGIPAEAWRWGFLTPDMIESGLVDWPHVIEKTMTIHELVKNAPY